MSIYDMTWNLAQSSIGTEPGQIFNIGVFVKVCFAWRTQAADGCVESVVLNSQMECIQRAVKNYHGKLSIWIQIGIQKWMKLARENKIVPLLTQSYSLSPTSTDAVVTE